MYVRTFLSDSMEEAFGQIKKELGPQAVILKTITHKGLKGAFKKKKIEITAAITEEEYLKKKQMEKNLSEEQRQKVFTAPAGEIKSLINTYSSHSVKKKKEQEVASKNYGIQGNLSDFLREESQEEKPIVAEAINSNVITQTQNQNQNQNSYYYDDSLLKESLSLLEQKILSLQNEISSQKKDTSFEIFLALGIHSHFLLEMREGKKMTYDQYLEKFNERLVLKTPEWLLPENRDKKVITLFPKEASCGMSSFLSKMASTIDNSVIFRSINEISQKIKTMDQMLNQEVEYYKDEIDLIQKVEKQGNKKIFVEFSCSSEKDPKWEKVKKMLKNGHSQVFIHLLLSQLWAYEYAQSMIVRYQGQASFYHLSFLDKVQNYSNILNFSFWYPKISLGFFSISEEVPSGLEMANKERIMSFFPLIQE